MVDFLCGSGHEIAERSKLLFLHQLGLKLLLAVVGAAGLTQERDRASGPANTGARKRSPAKISIVISTVYKRNMREGMGDRSYRTVQSPNTGRDRMASMAMRGTTFFHPGWRLNLMGFKSQSRGRKRSCGAPSDGGHQRNVIRASRVVGAIGGGTIQQLRVHRIDAESAQVVGVETAPVPGAGENGYCQNREQENMFRAIKAIVVDVVLYDIQVHILLREDDEGIKEDPPAEQHQEVEQAEEDLAFFVLQVRTPAHGGEHGYRVEEQDDVKNEGVGDLAVKNGLPDGPGCLICDPAREPQSDAGPRNCAPGRGGARRWSR